MKTDKQLVKDAMRYRFLRSLESRDHNDHSRYAFCVGKCDWAKKLGDKGINMWSRLDISEDQMDEAIDRAMKRKTKKP